jgi:hypothetical protein
VEHHAAGELRPDLCHRLGAILPAFLEHAQDERLEEDRDSRQARAKRRGRVVLVHHERRDNGLADEGHVPGEDLVAEDAERIDVRPRVHHGPCSLLGGHVLRRPHHRANAGQVLALEIVELRDAEVEHLDVVGLLLTLDEHHVVGLQVAMNDALRVCGCERPGHLVKDGKGALHRQAPRAA